ncbi:hypothetical protein HMPREF0204_10139 [Chryseobacterium gleum ATCC 35910]|uniref:Uncharacterized protein n=1 Tax=Chryseobacterium gleum ATCC 35910 TaxID=525257 RepID=A0ABP2IU98_CHRGE|nr:hypothetical protein HMPREF0204_10139 [Chryseobacterium gleum ATCC 35910]
MVDPFTLYAEIKTNRCLKRKPLLREQQRLFDKQCNIVQLLTY